jgi:GNAT superfamily N-acetyltransferase
MLTLLRTNSQNLDFKTLIKLLDKGLKITDGDDHDFYNQFNKIENIKYVVIIYEDKVAVGCGAIKKFSEKIVEVKRMYVAENQRGRGAASMILQELEQWAVELSFENCILETGTRQIEALKLYPKNGYSVIENYGQYAGIENSVCFEKPLL